MHVIISLDAEKASHKIQCPDKSSEDTMDTVLISNIIKVNDSNPQQYHPNKRKTKHFHYNQDEIMMATLFSIAILIQYST